MLLSSARTRITTTGSIDGGTIAAGTYILTWSHPHVLKNPFSITSLHTIHNSVPTLETHTPTNIRIHIAHNLFYSSIAGQRVIVLRVSSLKRRSSVAGCRRRGSWIGANWDYPAVPTSLIFKRNGRPFFLSLCTTRLIRIPVTWLQCRL